MCVAGQARDSAESLWDSKETIGFVWWDWAHPRVQVCCPWSWFSWYGNTTIGCLVFASSSPDNFNQHDYEDEIRLAIQVEIVMGLEEEFGISVEEESSQNITTVQEAADLIEKLVQKKPEA